MNTVSNMVPQTYPSKLLAALESEFGPESVYREAHDNNPVLVITPFPEERLLEIRVTHCPYGQGTPLEPSADTFWIRATFIGGTDTGGYNGDSKSMTPWVEASVSYLLVTATFINKIVRAYPHNGCISVDLGVSVEYGGIPVAEFNKFKRALLRLRDNIIKFTPILSDQ
jgi:hypothetical protein